MKKLPHGDVLRLRRVAVLAAYAVAGERGAAWPVSGAAELAE
jgi:hypothetical protein